MTIPDDLDRALVAHYGNRPDRLAEVRANAEAWERLTAMAVDGPVVSAARGIGDGPESASATSPRPVSTTRAAPLSKNGAR